MLASIMLTAAMVAVLMASIYVVTWILASLAGESVSTFLFGSYPAPAPHFTLHSGNPRLFSTWEELAPLFKPTFWEKQGVEKHLRAIVDFSEAHEIRDGAGETWIGSTRIGFNGETYPRQMAILCDILDACGIEYRKGSSPVATGATRYSVYVEE